MSTQHFLYQDYYPINDDIKIMIPKVGEILDIEDEYYSIVSAVTSMPIDFMLPLHDMGIDFTEINSWELFIMLFGAFSKEADPKALRLVFGDLDLSKFELMTNKQNDTLILVDSENGITIDRAIHNQMAAVLRKIHHLEKNNRKPGNEEAKEYMLERARAKAKRNRNRKKDSDLESLIIAMVNNEHFKYDFEGTRELSIYQFRESVKQVIKKTDYDNRMYGVYTGTVNPKDLSPDDMNWLIH